MDNKQSSQEESLESEPKPAVEQVSTPSEATAEPTPLQPEPNSPPEPQKESLYKKLTQAKYLYLIIFGFFLLVIGAVTYISVNDNSPKNPGATPLTAENLSSLRGATTVVGDPKQILDIQSNAIFEGQILARGDINAAGDVKVGKEVSAASATFGQIQSSGTLSVSGNGTFSSSLSVRGNLSVSADGSFSGNLSAGQLTVGTLNLTSDLAITKHITVKGSVPRVSSGSVGSGGTVSVSGTDTAGTVTINTGSGPAAGNLATVTFAAAFQSTPHVVITPIGTVAGTLDFYITRSSGAFTIATINSPPGGTSFSFDYIVIN